MFGSDQLFDAYWRDRITSQALVDLHVISLIGIVRRETMVQNELERNLRLMVKCTVCQNSGSDIGYLFMSKRRLDIWREPDRVFEEVISL